MVLMGLFRTAKGVWMSWEREGANRDPIGKQEAGLHPCPCVVPAFEAKA